MEHHEKKKKYKQCFYLLILFPHSFSCTWLPLGLVVIFFPHTVLNHNCSTCAELWSSLSCDQILQHVDTVNSVLRIQTKGLNPRSYVTAVYENVINVRFFFSEKKKKTRHENNNNNNDNKKNHLYVVNSLCRPIWKTLWYENRLYTMMESLLMVIVAVAMATKWQHGYLFIILIVIFFPQ